MSEPSSGVDVWNGQKAARGHGKVNLEASDSRRRMCVWHGGVTQGKIVVMKEHR